MSKARGTTPKGATSEESAARWVRGMFGEIAPTYDVVNNLLSFQIDRYWRWKTVRRLRPLLRQPGARTLDLCCGTGALLTTLEAGRGGPVFGSDFSHPMLTAAQRKIAQRGYRSKLFEADALRLPLADASLDVITIAFGFRNFANYAAGLRELRRVVRPGGTLALLEFSQPPNAVFAGLYRFYSGTLLPWLGGLVSGSREAYAYLPASVRKFPGAEELADDLRGAGFDDVEFTRMTGGIVALHVAH